MAYYKYNYYHEIFNMWGGRQKNLNIMSIIVAHSQSSFVLFVVNIHDDESTDLKRSTLICIDIIIFP